MTDFVLYFSILLFNIYIEHIHWSPCPASAQLDLSQPLKLAVRPNAPGPGFTGI